VLQKFKFKVLFFLPIDLFLPNKGRAGFGEENSAHIGKHITCRVDIDGDEETRRYLRALEHAL
jgi:hypothetical protein